MKKFFISLLCVSVAASFFSVSAADLQVKTPKVKTPPTALTPFRRGVAAGVCALATAGFVASTVLTQTEKKKTRNLFRRKPVKRGCKDWFTSAQGLSLTAAGVLTAVGLAVFPWKSLKTACRTRVVSSKVLSK